MNYQKPLRIFEEEGLVVPTRSYHIEIENVVNTKNQGIKTMVDHGRYFSIFAPRQSGKTTFFRDVCHKLEKDPTYVTILLNFENCSNLDKAAFYQRFYKDFRKQLINRLTKVNCQQIDTIRDYLNSHPLSNHDTFEDLFHELNRIIQFKKIVIFIDEFDGIPLGELENFLTTLRKLYHWYKEENNKALYSIGLVGIRDITKLAVGGVSPFNIADEVSLPSFNLKSIRELYSQYSAETNQPFMEEATKEICEITGGQPWLVNRLGTILTTNIKPETVEPVTLEDVSKATEILLEENNRHFINLWEKIQGYRETFLKIGNDEVKHSPHDHDQSWLRQYGLIKKEKGMAKIANPIYKRRFLDVLSNLPRKGEKEQFPQKGQPILEAEEKTEKRVVAMLFSDLKGFSKIKEDQLKVKIQEMNDDIRKKFLTEENHFFVNTWGDAFFICSHSYVDLAIIALKIRDYILQQPWIRMGFPIKLGIRIGLHVAEARIISNGGKITNVIGVGVDTTARIEPVTEANQVFCSQPFHSHLISTSDLNIVCRPVGVHALAKNYGEMELFSVHWDYEVSS